MRISLKDTETEPNVIHERIFRTDCPAQVINGIYLSLPPEF